APRDLHSFPTRRSSDLAKVTDQLLAMGRAAGSGDRKTALKLSRALRERHYNAAGELLGTALFTQFHSDLGIDFDALDELLRGIRSEEHTSELQSRSDLV